MRGGLHDLAGHRGRRGFTLLELLVVILIILLVSVVGAATVLPALNHRQLSEAGRILQGALVGARDKAIHDGQPAGIRLLPDPTLFSVQPATLSDGTTPNPQAGWVDPTQALAYNRLTPIEPAPEYTEGMVSVYPTSGGSTAYAAAVRTVNGYSGVPCLVLESALADPKTGLPNPPTSWFWNVRVGDRIQINNAGAWYTIVGPDFVGPAGGNTERFVNNGAPGSSLPALNGGATEFLLLVNGRDDNGNGWIDDGWDGVDNDGSGVADDATYDKAGNLLATSEWAEAEAWQGAIAAQGAKSVPYTIQRRPSPTFGSREVALPTGIVVDATTWKNATRERSRLPVNVYNGLVEIMVNPDGSVFYSLPYGVPSSVGMDQAFSHFWLAERGDVAAPDPDPTRTAPPWLPLPEGLAATAGVTAPQATLEGRWGLLSVSRAGLTSFVEEPSFLHDPTVGFNNQTGSYNANNPFIPAEQGGASR